MQLLLLESTAEAAQQFWKEPFAFWASNCGRAGATPALAVAHIRLPLLLGAASTSCTLQAPASLCQAGGAP